MRRMRIFLIAGVILFHVLPLCSQGSSTDSILRLWLSPQIVNNEKPVANTFYFWVTPEELDSVVSQQRLLRNVRPSSSLEISYFTLLQRNASSNETLANYLMSGKRQRVRSSWPCYWSVLTPKGTVADETQLIQVVLKDSSLIVTINELDKKKERWQVFDLKGNPVPMKDALVRRRHIAAVFYCGKWEVKFIGPRTERFTEYERTFYLCNEDMIKSWHHAVPGMQARILNDLNYLVLLTAWFENPEHCMLQGKKAKNCRRAWTGLASQMKISELFFATLCFASKYDEDANQESMKSMVDQLRERWRAQKNPVERFSGKK